MEKNKMNIESEKRKKSQFANLQDYVKSYAKKCRYSFNGMLTI